MADKHCRSYTDSTLTRQSTRTYTQSSQMCILLSSGWDDNLNGGKLCLYHKSGGKDDGICGEQVTLVAPAGDTLVVFDSHMEHEVMPSFADRYTCIASIALVPVYTDAHHSILATHCSSKHCRRICTSCSPM